MRWLVIIVTTLFLFYIIGWFSGSKNYGAKDDERSQWIKQKSMGRSWVFMLAVFVLNIIFDFFDLRTGPLKNAPFNHPELFYLIVLIGSYLVYYFIFSKRLSSNEK